MKRRFQALLLTICLLAGSLSTACSQEKDTEPLQIIDDNYRNYYEIFVGSFYDSNGDGVGDLQGVIEKLDYINDGDDETDTDLGFNGIWLMPIMPSDTYHKYDVKDYYSIDEAYGTMEDMEQLIEECHKRGINLIIDFVFNHTSASHPWFEEACDYLKALPEGAEPDAAECKYVNYYNFARDKAGLSTWHKVGNSEWYYECVFWDQMPDLNLGNEDVRKEIEDIASFWLDKGVDGFRLDAAKEYYSGQVDKNVEVLSWFTNYVKSVDKNAYIVAEVWEKSDTIAQYYASGITSLFDFPMSQIDGRIGKTVRGMAGDKSFTEALESFDNKYRAQNPSYIDAPFISNHDTARVGTQFAYNEEQMKYAAGLLLTENGSPFVYYGEEIGMASSGTKDENKRLAMYWSDEDETGITNDPVGADKVEQKFAPVDKQMEDENSIYNYYKKALRIRNTYPEIARGTIHAVSGITLENVSAMTKTWNDETIGIIYNSSSEEVAVTLEDMGMEKMSVCNYLTVDGSEVTSSKEEIKMPAYSIVFLK